MALLKFKRSAVPAKIPSIADLALGELAINTYDGKVYTKKDDGTQAIVEVGGGGGVQTITSSDGSVTVTGTTDINLSVPVTAATNTVILPVRNNSGATLAKGTAVYINGALGQNPTVTKAIATGDATSAQTLGLVTANIANNTVGNVTLIGTLTNVDTSAFSDGQQLYLSPTTAGALTATKPYAPSHLVYMAVVEHAHPALGKLFVKVQNGYEMDELHDVSAQNPANNDGLFYNTTSGLWEKKSIATALGYTPANKAGDAFTGGVYSAGQIRAAGWWGDVSASATGLGVEIGESGNRSYVISYSRDTAAYGPMSFEATDFTFTGVSGGYIGVNTSVRAPIFYDSNNTGYYVDPASTSNLVGLTVANTISGSISGNAATVSSITNLTNLGRNSLIAGVVDGLTTTNFRTTMFGNAVSTYNIVTSRWNNVPTAFSGLGPYGTAIAWSGSDTHAFLALNYNSAGAKIGGGSSDNINWSADLLHSSNYTSYAMPTGSSATNSVDVRAPIFYDSNDTAFYIDPNTNSVLNTLYFRNTSGGQVKAFNASSFGYSSSYKTLVIGNEYLSTVCIGVDVSGNASGSFNGQGEGREVLFRNGVSFITPNAANTNYLNVMQMTDGVANFTAYATAAGSFRAPIFYDSNNTGFYVDPNATSNLSRLSAAGRSMVGSATLDMSGLDQNTWYPVTIPIAAARQTRLRIENALNSNAPSWSTHPAGFSCYVEWTSNGAGWGTIGLNRRVVDWRESFTSVQIVGGIDQLTQSSTEVIWLRGGGNYFFSADNDVNPTIRTSTYEINGQSVSPRTTTYNTPWTASTGQTGAAIFYATSTITSATDVRAPIFYDSNDTSYYVDANSTSVLNGINVWGEIGARRNDVQSILRSYNLSAGSPLQFYLDHNYGHVNIGNSRGVVYAGGSYWEIANSVRAPIFYDSNNTTYYIDPEGGTRLGGQLEVLGGRPFTYNASGGSITIKGDAGGWATGTYFLGSSGTNRGGFGALGGGDGLSYLWAGNAYNDAALYIYAAGHTVANTSLRAPIFYDSNNTAYYVDPHSNSVLYKFENINQRVAYDRGWDNYPSITVYNTTDQGPQNDFRIHGIGGANGGDFAVRLLVDGDITSLANINAGGAFYGQGFYDSNNTGYYLDASSGGTSLNVAGSIVAAGNVTAYSDIRIKANVETIPSALDKLDQIRGVTYTRTDLDDKEQRYAGVIAQEIEAVLPEAVRDLGNIKAVDYNATIALLIQAVKELRDEVEALRK